MCRRCENKCKPKCPCDSPKKHCKPANIDTKCTLADIEFRDGGTPSDNNTAVGIDRLVCCVNYSWSILNKQTNEVLSRTDVYDFFPGLPTSPDSSASDPVVQWDEFENRFIGIVWEQVDFNVDSLITVETPEGISGEYQASRSSAFNINAQVTVETPGSISGEYDAFKSTAFPGDFDFNGEDIVPANPLNADTPLVNDLTGKIALIAVDGLRSESVNKCTNAFNAGAIGCILYEDGELILGSITGIPEIPSVIIINSAGLEILNNQPVTGGIKNLPPSEFKPAPFDLSGVEIVPADPLNADTPLVNDLTGKIALIAGDGFQTGSINKCTNALNAGAIGCILYEDGNILGAGIFGIPEIPAVITVNSIGLSLLNNQPVVGGIRNLSAEEIGQDAYSKMHICVSKDSSPNDASDFYFYEIGTIDGPYKRLIADYPKIGLDADALYISSQDVESLPNGNFNVFRHIVAVEKSGLIDGTAVSPLPLLVDDLDTVFLDGQVTTNPPITIPTVNHTPQTNTNQVMFFVRGNIDSTPNATNTNGDAFIIKSISNVLGAPTIQEFTVSVEPWVAPPFSDGAGASVVQPDGIFQDPETYGFPPFSLDARPCNAFLTYRCVQYKDSLWFAMHVGPSGKREVRWYEIDVSQFFNLEGPSITLKQEGKIVPEGTTSAFYPSIDVDKDGNMGIGFNICGPGQPVAIAHTGRLASDPVGTVRLPYQVNFVAQPDLPFFDFSVDFSGPVWFSRWNDYTSCVLDPVDRKTFNFTCQYSNLSLDDYFNFDPQWKSGLVTFCVTEEEGKTKTKSGQKCSVVKTKVTEPLKVQSRNLSSKQTEEVNKLSKMTKEECVCYLKELGQKKANAEFLRKGRKVKIGKFKPKF